jgi:hypothetical protein
MRIGRTWHTDVGATVASESVSQATVAARANLSLNREVNLSKVVRTKLQRLKLGIGLQSCCCIFSGNPFSEPTSAVFASPTALSQSWGTLRSYKVIVSMDIKLNIKQETYECWLVS